ncbi:reverse transcriptase domain-containing protein [Ureibacillus composti]
MDELILKPVKSDLINEITLSLARKKADNYIRNTNWYNDQLELDLHVLNSEEDIKKWHNSLKKVNFKTNKIKIIPAPKSHKWEVTNSDEDFEKWIPVENEEKEFATRPLGRISLRDQTYAVAGLMCLANIVETRQGPTNFGIKESINSKVKSFGNRLHCNWINDVDGKYKADFSYGNKQLYRKYFEDFELFLERPKEICMKKHKEGIEAENLFVLSFDLEKFYDNVNISLLIEKVSNLIEKTMDELDPQFIETLKKILSWEKDNDKITKKFDTYEFGLPQGLAASGFLANIYLLDFDDEIKSYINKNLKNNNVKVLDYIRYVDDIRITIELTEPEKIKNISTEIGELLNKYFDEKEYGLNINDGKNECVNYLELTSNSTQSTNMKLLQNRLSSSPDIESLEQIILGFNGMLDISKNVKSNVVFNKSLEITNLLNNESDVKSETLIKFAAFRLYKSLGLKEKLNKIDILGIQNSTSLFNQEKEYYSKKLVSIWLNNPSLFQLLKFSLDLYPNDGLAKSIIELLKTKLYTGDRIDTSSMNQKYIAEFVAMDLFMATSQYIGYQKREYNIKELDKFRSVMVGFAEEVLLDPNLSMHLKNAALLCIITHGEKIETNNFKKNEVDINYYYLACLSRYQLVEEIGNINIKTAVIVMLVVQQIRPNKLKFHKWLNSIIEVDNIEIIFNILEIYDKSLIKYFSSSSYITKDYILDYIKENYQFYNISFPNNGEFYSLEQIINCNNNPFSQENAVLILIEKLLSDYEFINLCNKEEISLEVIEIKCNDWNNVFNPNISRKSEFLEIKYIGCSKYFSFPKWLNKERRVSYFIGVILRACLVGNSDFTISNYSITDNNNKYIGIRDSLETRKLSMNNYRYSLNKNLYPISPEVLDLIFVLLMYPGLRVSHNVLLLTDYRILKSNISELIERAIKCYCKLSNIPGYVYKLKNTRYYSKEKIRIVSVQTLLPYVEEFSFTNPNNLSNKFKKKHRNHIASICNLVINYLKTHSAVEGKEPYADIIVFPEISINYDDIDLLKELSDYTKANIFAGLTYFRNNVEDETLVNRGLWLLREEIGTGRNFVEIFQGKQYPTQPERKISVVGDKPYQVFIELPILEQGFKVTGVICYDATNLTLAADLRDISDLFIISAYNKDINTFDNMVASLNYHMYQPVVLVNCGFYGGSTVQAPYSDHFKMISNTHGGNQIGISISDLDPTSFKSSAPPKEKLRVKTSPAGYNGRPI